jgi:hypothetical protein
MTADKSTTEKLAELQKKSQERTALKTIMLPDWHDSKRGTPNSFLRSALFSAVQSKDRQFKKREILFSQNGMFIRYTGEQLNQEDLTLWEALLHLTRKQPLGNVCEFSAYEILKAMGMATGKADYERLHCGITRLAACLVEITYDNTNYFRSLIEGGKREELTGLYQLQINRDLIKLYGNSNWSIIDWEHRLLLRKKPLAQALLGYYSCHKTPYPVTLLFLQGLTGGKNKSLAGFKRHVIAALKELVKIGFLESYYIGNNLISVVKIPGKNLKNSVINYRI